MKVLLDPSVTVYPTASFITYSNQYASTGITYVPGNASRLLWLTGSLSMASALDELSTWYFARAGLTNGQVNFWNGTSWTNGISGTTNDILFGGTTPTFRQLYTHGDVTNTYTNLCVVKVQHVPVAAPVAGNDGMVLTYNNTSTQMEWVAGSTAAQGVAGTNAQQRVSVLETNTATLAQGIAATNAQERVSVVETNKATLAEGIAATNAQARVAILETNTASLAQGIAGTNAQQRVGVLEARSSLSRYFASNTLNYEIQVLASGLGITATVIGNTVTLSIPSGVILISCQVRWPASSSSTTFTFNIGTADMPNSSDANRWGGIFEAWRNDTGAMEATASCALDASNKAQLIITGLSVQFGVVNICRFSF